MSLRDDILAKDDLPREELDVPEWGVTVLVRGMTAGERDRFESQFLSDKQGGKGDADVRARVAALTLCGPDGAPLFTPADVAALSRKSAAALDRVLPVAMRLSGVTKEDVGELEGN